jgi:multicomponent Na+:H+ antiporter subunit D
MILSLEIWSFVAIPLLIAIGILTAITGIKRRHAAPFTAIGGMGVALLFVIMTIPDVIGGNTISFQMSGWLAPFGISIVVDTLTIILSLLITGIGLLATIFSYRVIKNRKPEFYALICLLIAGLLGIVHTGDLFNLFVFFEVSNVSSYALVAYYRKKRSAEASIKFLIIGSIASSMILIGIGLIYATIGTLNMAGLALILPNTTGTIIPIALGLMISGFAMKGGIIPFHFWMPDAYSAAPSPIGAILGGLSVNAGLYSILRVGWVVFSAPNALLTVLMFFGIASMLIGAIFAIIQTDLKRMLAYSSISQVGYIIMAIGLGTTLGMVGGVFHIINHAIIKGLLFLCAGILIFHARTSNMYEIGRKLKFGSVLTYSFLIGILALAGIPFFNGFSSKWVIYISTFEISVTLTIFTIMISVLTFAYGIRAFYLMFMSGGNRTAQKTPWSMIIPVVILAIVCIVLGLVPQIGIGVSETIGSGLASASAYTGAVLG